HQSTHLGRLGGVRNHEAHRLMTDATTEHAFAIPERAAPGRPDPRHCYIYFFDGWIGIAPTVVGLARMLASDGYMVTIYCPRTVDTEAGQIASGVSIRYV